MTHETWPSVGRPEVGGALPEPGTADAPEHGKKLTGPGSAPAPGVTPEPGRTSGPSGTLAPGVTPEPGRTSGPSGTLAPGVTSEPDSTLEPDATPGSGGTPEPEVIGPLWLVRHGQSGWNVSGRIQGQSPAAPGLTAVGREQAAVAARGLGCRAPRASLIMASDLARAAETADIIGTVLGLPVEYDPDLREQGLGVLEGLIAASPAAAEITGAPSAAFGDEDALDELWRRPLQRPLGGESVADMYARVHRALGRITASQPGAGLIIVTHGGPVRVATAAPPSPGRPMARTLVGNASITRWPPADGPAR